MYMYQSNVSNLMFQSEFQIIKMQILYLNLYNIILYLEKNQYITNARSIHMLVIMVQDSYI